MNKLTNLRPLPKPQAMTAGDLHEAFPAWRDGLRVQRHVFVDGNSIPQANEKANKVQQEAS